MEIIATIASLLKITEIVLSIRDKLKKNDEVSYYLHNIGILIESVAVDLTNNNYPHSKCSQMNYYLDNLKFAVKKHLTEEQYLTLQMQLNEAYNVERMFGEYGTMNEELKQKNLNLLQSISGTFIATSETVKL